MESQEIKSNMLRYGIKSVAELHRELEAFQPVKISYTSLTQAIKGTRNASKLIASVLHHYFAHMEDQWRKDKIEELEELDRE